MGGGLIENKATLKNDGIEWDIVFDYPVNSYLNIKFANGSMDFMKGRQQISSGYPSFAKPTIVSITPSEDDMYKYTF